MKKNTVNVAPQIVAVFFEDGARSTPHTHATDQVLYVVSGICVVADESDSEFGRRGSFNGSHDRFSTGGDSIF